MPQFSYKAVTPGGAIHTGTMEAKEQRFVIEQLHRQRYVVLEISQTGRLSKTGLKGLLGAGLKKKIKLRDIVLFSRQLSTMINAGVPIVQGLNIIIDQLRNPAFKNVITSIRDDIETGISIADAMSKHPHVFSELYVSMIKAGELGGILDVILERLSGYLEATQNLRGKIRSALMYPAVIALVAAGIGTFLLIVIIPKFEVIFSSVGADLPFLTRLLIGLSKLLKKYIFFIFIVLVVFVLLLRRYYKTEAGSMKIDHLLLRLPVIGPLLRKVAIAKFSRTLGTLIKSGVPILQGLETVAKTSGNRVIEKAVLTARESIREGERIAPPLKVSNVFPPMVIQMISVGEETGNLDTMLAKIADFYDQEVDAAVIGLTSLIEPVIIVLMGIIIGVFVIAMYLPLFQMGQLAGKM